MRLAETNLFLIFEAFIFKSNTCKSKESFFFNFWKINFEFKLTKKNIVTVIKSWPASRVDSKKSFAFADAEGESISLR